MDRRSHYAYSNTILSLTPHPDTQQGVVANCSGASQILESGDFGAVGFGIASGTNPCLETPITGGAVHALRVDLTEPPGWPVAVPLDADTDPSPALGDVNNDGTLDVVIGSTDGHLYAISGSDGSELPGFPLMVGSPIHSSAAIADIDSDGYSEVFFGDNAGYTYGVTSTGIILDGLPILNNDSWGTPAVYDIDGDGKPELLARNSNQRIYSWAFETSISVDPTWPQFKHDPAHTGLVTNPIFPPSTTGVNPGVLPPQVLRPTPNPFRSETTLRFYLSKATTLPIRLTIFDISGRLIYQRSLPGAPAGWNEMPWDGKNRDGTVLASGVYLSRLEIGPLSTIARLIRLGP